MSGRKVMAFPRCHGGRGARPFGGDGMGEAATYFSGPHDTITSRQYETGLSNNAQGHEEESGWGLEPGSREIQR